LSTRIPLLRRHYLNELSVSLAALSLPDGLGPQGFVKKNHHQFKMYLGQQSYPSEKLVFYEKISKELFFNH